MITRVLPTNSVAVRKLTISLPVDLAEFADWQAAHRRVSRSQVISEALAALKAQEQERLAVEGYQFYADEAAAFAQSSMRAVAETLGSHSDWFDEWEENNDG